MVVELLKKRSSGRIEGERVGVGRTVPVRDIDRVSLWDHGVVWAMISKDIADRVNI
jgi:hypothetical protein